MPALKNAFRIGRVKGYVRNQVWYLCYHERGRRRRPRVGSDLRAARTLAAQINAQLEAGAATALSCEPITLSDLRQRWLDHHEHVLRSSLQTINRYRAASEHLLKFARHVRPVKLAWQFSARDAEEFVRYLRTIEVAPNGHKNAARRRLLDKGIIYILESCRAMFTYAAKRRHLSAYAENPFTTIEIGRIPVENAKPVILPSGEQERRFLECCDDWQFPVFLTLMLTGLRPGELAHLLLPEDLDLTAGVLRVRNKPKLGWQVKTRSERDIPLAVELVGVLKASIGDRAAGPAFLRPGVTAPLSGTRAELEATLQMRVTQAQQEAGGLIDRQEYSRLAKALWWEAGAVREDRIRLEFMRVARGVGLSQLTMPKVLRHQFATALQDANVDPLIRNQLMGHAPAVRAGPGSGLGMTAVYTHTRAETARQQLQAAMARRPAAQVAREWLAQRAQAVAPQEAA